MSASPEQRADGDPGAEAPAGRESFRLRRPSTANAVAQLLRTRLVAGEYGPGETMSESALARRLAVSRPTMRGALQQLAREGLLTHHLHRGMLVTALSAQDIADIYHVRAVLESAGLRAAHAAGAPLAAPAAAVEAFAAAVAGGDALAIVDADIGFHTSLVGLTASERLVATHTSAVGQLRLGLSRMDLASSDAERQFEEHLAIVRALERGRLARALEVLARHLESAQSQLAVFVRDHGEG